MKKQMKFDFLIFKEKWYIHFAYGMVFIAYTIGALFGGGLPFSLYAGAMGLFQLAFSYLFWYGILTVRENGKTILIREKLNYFPICKRENGMAKVGWLCLYLIFQLLTSCVILFLSQQILPQAMSLFLPMLKIIVGVTALSSCLLLLIPSRNAFSTWIILVIPILYVTKIMH